MALCILIFFKCWHNLFISNTSECNVVNINTALKRKIIIQIYTSFQALIYRTVHNCILLSQKMELPQLTVGQKFNSFVEWEEIYTQFVQSTSIPMYISDSRKVDKSRTKCNMNPSIKYYQLLYTCIHGGRKFQSRSHGERDGRSLKLVKCPVKIRLGASGDGQHLEIKEIILKHTHSADPVYQHLPHHQIDHNYNNTRVNSKLSSQQKFCQAMIQFKEIATVMSEMSDEKFKKEFEFVKNLKDRLNQEYSFVTTGSNNASPTVSKEDQQQHLILASTSDVNKKVPNIENENIEAELNIPECAREGRQELEDNSTDSNIVRAETLQNDPCTFNRGDLIAKIKMPPTIKLKERPKGLGKTWLDIPKRPQQKKKCSFMNKSLHEQHKMMIEWFTSQDVCGTALASKTKIRKEDLLTRPLPSFPDAVCDDQIKINAIEKFFTSEAWKVIENIYAEKRKLNKWSCLQCNLDLNQDKSILCDGCLNWFHFKCVKFVEKNYKSKEWFCHKCL